MFLTGVGSVTSDFPIEFQINDPQTIAHWVLVFPYLQWNPESVALPTLTYKVTAKVTRETTNHSCKVLGILGWGGFGVVFLAQHGTLGRLAIKIPRQRLTDTDGLAPNKEKEKDLDDDLEAFAKSITLPISQKVRLEFEKKLAQRLKEESGNRPSDLNRQIVKRFERECEVLQRIDHPHVVKILHVGDVGVVDQNNQWKHLSTCIAMSFLDGTKAFDAIKNQKRAELEANLEAILRFAKQIALGAAAIHDTGSPHRDLSWGNILIESKTGNGVIVDLGNVMGDTRIDSINTNVKDLYDETKPIARVFGWPGFIAPEQRVGLPEKASDQFSLGVSLYHWFAGQMPFQQLSLHVYIPNGTGGPISIRDQCKSLASTWSPAAQQALNDVCASVMRCLDERAIERHESMRDFAATMEAILIDLGKSSFSALTPAEVTPVGHFLVDAMAIDLRGEFVRQAAASQVLTAFARLCRLVIERSIAVLQDCVIEYVDESIDLKSVGEKYEELVKRVEKTLDQMKEMLRVIRLGLHVNGIRPNERFGGELQDRIHHTVESISDLHGDVFRRLDNPAMKIIKKNRDANLRSETQTEKEFAKQYLDLLEKVRRFQSELGNFDFSFAVYVLQLQKLIASLQAKVS